MIKYKVGIVGCGAILPRHLEAIKASSDYELIAVCDIQEALVRSVAKRLNVKAYTNFEDMVNSKTINFVVIATPNSLHTEQAMYALGRGCDVLIEKPVAFTKDDVLKIKQKATQNNQKAYCVLQVRLNPTVQLVKDVLKENLLGNIRSVSLIQRWQRPLEYFTGWRAEPNVGGGTLYEVGIHYLDVLQYLFGKPEVHSSKTYEIKHKEIGIEDTVYSLFDFGSYGGTCEITIAAEPQNLECSLSVLGSNGYIKLGGKAMNIVESAKFLSHGCQVEFDKLSKNYQISTEPNSYGSYQGSCPNHPFVYQNLEDFSIEQTLNVIDLIESMYGMSGRSYGKTSN